MASKLHHIKNLREIFIKSVGSVQPNNLLSVSNQYRLRPQADIDGSTLTIQIQGKTLDIARKRCFVVGFGKAVLGMAVQLERCLQEHLVGGTLSIPCGTLQQFKNIMELQLAVNTHITVVEGAANNQPDEAAMAAAANIKQLASSLTDNDILFVLISGGGSALLPLPRSPLTLQEKMQLVRQLSNRGASIDEMNVVRIALSDIKGGRLAAAARNAHAVISFVISDIVGDPVELIASGPTCSQTNSVVGSKRLTAQDVLEKYGMWQRLPPHIRQLVEVITPITDVQPARNNFIYVVGDNRVATATAVQQALLCGYNPFIATTTLQGEVPQLVSIYTKFLQSLHSFRQSILSEDELKQCFPFDMRIFEHFLKTLSMCEKTEKPLLLIFAGEPTVKVTGSGLGGRNQELALRMSLALYQNTKFADMSFLSAGTDGIDGPTPAAGAIGDSLVVKTFLEQAADNSLAHLEAYLKRNDSYRFYKNLQDGAFHIITGHTGTNVMDLQLLLVP